MASPDIRPYVDLTIYDRSAQDLVDQALIDAGTKLPGWVAREGDPAVTWLEALALVVAESIFALNRLPGALIEALLGLYGAGRSEGLPPTTTVTINAADALGHVIPAGTRLQVILGADLEALELTTDVDLNIVAPATAGDVAATATENTTRANGVAAGAPVEVIDAVAFIEDAELAAPIAGGVDPEDSTAYLNRASQVLRRLSSTLVLPEHFTAAALENVAVYRATTLDEFDPATGPDPGDNPGHVTVAVAAQGGGALTGPQKTALEDDLEARALASLDVHILDPTITAVPVTVTVRRKAGFADQAVEDAVTAALEGYLDPDSWPWGAVVRRFELIALIDQVAGVDFVEVLTAPAADVNLAGDAPLADAGAIAVTVNPPA